MARVLLTLRRSLEADDLQSHVRVNGKVYPMYDVSFVDDCIVPVSGEAEKIVAKTTAIASVAYSVFLCFKMLLNFSPGKFEAMVQFGGKGKKAAVSSLSRNGSQSVFYDKQSKPIILRFVCAYKHVGTYGQSNLRSGKEVSVRTAAMRSGSLGIRKQVLRNASIPVDKRLFILHVYIFTKGAFQCSTWSKLTNSEYKRFHACIMSLYRDVCDNYHGNKGGNKVLNDSDMLFQYDVSHPMCILRVARLSLFARVLVKAPEQFKELVLDMGELPQGWTRCVIGDLQWLALAPDFSACDGFTLAQWADCIYDKPKRFKKLVLKFSKMRVANIPAHSDKTNCIPVQPSVSFDCNVCSASFSTFQKLSLHSFKAHGTKSIWRHFVSESHTCEVCLVHFHSRERLLNHIRYRSRICKFNMQIRGPLYGEERAAQLDAEAAKTHVSLYSQGSRSHAAPIAAFRIEGPLMPILLPPEVKQSSHSLLGFGRNH